MPEDIYSRASDEMVEMINSRILNSTTSTDIRIDENRPARACITDENNNIINYVTLSPSGNDVYWGDLTADRHNFIGEDFDDDLEFKKWLMEKEKNNPILIDYTHDLIELGFECVKEGNL